MKTKSIFYYLSDLKVKGTSQLNYSFLQFLYDDVGAIHISSAIFKGYGLNILKNSWVKFALRDGGRDSKKSLI